MRRPKIIWSAALAALGLAAALAVAVSGPADARPAVAPADFCDRHPTHPRCVTPTPTPPPPGPVTLRQPDGGPDPYRGLLGGRVPIGVWFESVLDVGNVAMDLDAGLNTYVALTANSDLSLVAGAGSHAVPQQDEWRSAAGDTSGALAGWLIADELDMTQGPDLGYQTTLDIIAGLPDDGRLRYANYGKGVTFWESNAEAARFVNAQELVSADNYWFTDLNICGQWEGGALVNGATADLAPAECHRASNYGLTVQRLRSLVSPAGSRAVWAFVEVGHPAGEADWPTITPEQITAAVWHSFIAGARGVIYFNHSFGGPCVSQHALREPCYAAQRAAVKAVDARLQGLAPMLSAPYADGLLTASANVRAMAKWSGGHFYVVAGSSENAASTATFDVPCVGDASATVLDEGRSVPVTGGRFTDTFADGNAVHVYRIDGGSSCGL